MVHPKRLNKIKSENIMAILIFQHCSNSSFWRFQVKEFSFTVTFIINALIIKNNQKALSKQ